MSRQQQNQLLDIVNSVLTSQHFAVIATESNHQPYTSLVSFVSSADFHHLYFPTRKETQKFLNITENNHVAVLIDNRENNPSDLSKAITVIALGDAQEIVHKPEIIKKLLLQKHPDLSLFLSNTSCVLINITVHTYQIVQKFEQVQIIHI
jgi:nitroimidazol reductase NimA-like FMN-containing flavoprotein (pyridoxamine 5'-phosphate oxidase superfamily)